MRKYSFLLYALVLLAGQLANCQNLDKTDCKDEICLESIHFDSVRLNNTIPIMLSVNKLKELLGSPDSIRTEDNWECGNYINEESTVSVYYYGHSRFLVSKGTALLHRLNFEDGRFTFDFESNQIRKGTNVDDLRSFFPKAVRSLEEKCQGYNVDGRMKVLMKETPDYGDFSGWIFSFNDKTVKEIELWWFIC